MINELKILKDHGVQYVKDLRNAVLTPLFRGRPIVNAQYTQAEAELLKAICPSGAISNDGLLAIDLGRCVFCRECEFACPNVVQLTNDYHIAANRREDLIVRAGEDRAITIDKSLVRPKLAKLLGPSLKLRQVSAAGDNANEMELNACGNVNFDMGRMGIEFVASPRHADGLVITGPVSKNMAEALRICYEATPDPKIIVLVGTDAISGGLFADSQAIDRTFINTHHIDLYVPGNPAHPLTFINGLIDLLDIVRTR